jgi:hypothetical protein
VKIDLSLVQDGALRNSSLAVLRSLRDLRRRFAVEIAEVAFAARLEREPDLRAAVRSWLAGPAVTPDWVDWEQRKHERLLAA